MLALLGACSAFPGGARDSGSVVDPCEQAPLNRSPAEAVGLELNVEQVGSYCRMSGVGTLWWKVPDTFPAAGCASSPTPAGCRWRLQVHFESGTEAEDLDFRLGVLNAEGTGLNGQTVLGGCRQAAGQDEDCVVLLPERDTPYDGLYVAGWANTREVRGEVFRLRVTEYVPPQTGP